jgi:Niemann-Pick C2 protein
LSYIFFIGEDITAVKAVVHGIISGIPIPFPIPNADGCKNSNLVPCKKSEQNLNTIVRIENLKILASPN